MPLKTLSNTGAGEDASVSVVVTSYNYGRFLGACIDSILSQTHKPIEIVVVDDGSMDESRQVLEGYGDRIRAIFQANAGQAAAMSRGVAETTGAVVFLLDCDDVWEPVKVQRVLEVMRKYPSVGWVRHKARLVSEELEPLGQVLPRFRGSGAVPADPLLFLERIVNCQPSCLALRREVALRVFPLTIEPELQFDADDAVLFGRVFATGAQGYSIDEVLSSYRRHPGQRFGPHDLPRLMRREADVTAALPRIFGAWRTPSPAYKQYAVLAAIGGARPWHQERLRPYLLGLVAVARLYRRPRLMIRQFLALSLAFAAPDLWLRRLAHTLDWPPIQLATLRQGRPL